MAIMNLTHPSKSEFFNGLLIRQITNGVIFTAVISATVVISLGILFIPSKVLVVPDCTTPFTVNCGLATRPAIVIL